MKKLFFAVSALAALSLLAPSTGFAQGAHNQFGWYTDADMTASHVFGDAYSTHEVFMIVTNPYNESEGRPVEALGGIEFAYAVPLGNVLATVWANAATALDVGSGPFDHIVGWGTPVPVVDNVVVVGTKSILLMSADPFFGHLQVVSSGATFPESMAILDFDPGSGDGLQPLYPASGDLAEPVFGFNTDEVVATESTSFDSLKALYR